MRSLLIILALALAGCKEEVPEVRKPVPPAKHKVPNEFVMKDGCVVRVSSSMYNHHWGWRYYVAIPVNEWSKKCSQAKDTYLEEEIVKAKYK